MKLKPVRGRNQRGICFVSAQDTQLASGVFLLSTNVLSWCADIRTNERIPQGEVVLDSRIYDLLEAKSTAEIEVESYDGEIQILTELVAKVESTRGLDNNRVAEAISKRVSDLKDDLDGLILQKGAELAIEHLGIRFVISRLSPSSPARVKWEHLATMRLEAPADLQPCNVLIATEIGGAAHISDAHFGATENKRRIDVYLQAIRAFANRFDQYSNESLFSGFAFSDEVFQFYAFDSETGERSEIVSLGSSSIIDAYLDWIEDQLSDHSRAPSDLGDAVSDSIELAGKMSDENGLPTAILLFSSGIFSIGPNPVKSARRGMGQEKIGFHPLTAGADVELDILSAIGNLYGQEPIKIDNTSDVDKLLECLGSWTSKVTRS